MKARKQPVSQTLKQNQSNKHPFGGISAYQGKGSSEEWVLFLPHFTREKPKDFLKIKNKKENDLL